jgi:putative glycosyltransferase (TIGR04372 family)
MNNFKNKIKIILNLCRLEYIIALPILIIIRAIRPFILIRFGALISSRIGHLAANTDLYLCELNEGINKPKILFFDIFYTDYMPVCNIYLLKMWSRVINIWPALIIKPLYRLNQIIPGGKMHQIINTQHDRDVNNLLDKYPSFLKFTKEEEKFGLEELKNFGLTEKEKFVCLLVRDSAYLPNLSYHNYRDCTINNYLLVCEELTKRGYYIFRMGVKVQNKLITSNEKILDYATNGMRSEFMDIYLGAKCNFCISTSSGWDAIPLIFRKPIVFAPIVPLGYFFTFSNNFIAITKHHIDINENRELTMSEIFDRNVGFCMTSEDFYQKGVILIENTPEEILDVVIEYVDKSNNLWDFIVEDEQLQKSFWDQFPKNSCDDKGIPLHGEIKSSFGTIYLRKNKKWLSYVS